MKIEAISKKEQVLNKEGMERFENDSKTLSEGFSVLSYKEENREKGAGDKINFLIRELSKKIELVAREHHSPQLIEALKNYHKVISEFESQTLEESPEGLKKDLIIDKLNDPDYKAKVAFSNGSVEKIKEGMQSVFVYLQGEDSKYHDKVKKQLNGGELYSDGDWAHHNVSSMQETFHRISFDTNAQASFMNGSPERLINALKQLNAELEGIVLATHKN